MAQAPRNAEPLATALTFPDVAPCTESWTRREVVAQVAGWVIFAGALEAACTSGGGAATTDKCDCTQAVGTSTGLKKTDIPVNGVAYHAGAQLFVCHDLNGFYAMSSICRHANCDMGTQGSFVRTSLASGFTCSCHGSAFDSSGQVTRGPATVPMAHHPVGFDAAGVIVVNTALEVTNAACRCS